MFFYIDTGCRHEDFCRYCLYGAVFALVKDQYVPLYIDECMCNMYVFLAVY